MNFEYILQNAHLLKQFLGAIQKFKIKNQSLGKLPKSKDID
jgi:hypothetical protein